MELNKLAIKIFIDQGHNPINPNAGAEGNGLKEQDITYTIGVILANMLNGTDSYKAQVSRHTPSEILGTSNASSLQIRVARAIEFGADYFISLHCNASVIESATGCEAYAHSYGSTGFLLGRDIVENIGRITGLVDRGTFVRPTLYVLRKTPMPSTLIEMGFITNIRDAFLLESGPEYFARAIYIGIIQATT
jgi:N-acetylmuramoyl-L-alanine amidase